MKKLSPLEISVIESICVYQTNLFDILKLFYFITLFVIMTDSLPFGFSNISYIELIIIPITKKYIYPKFFLVMRHTCYIKLLYHR